MFNGAEGNCTFQTCVVVLAFGGRFNDGAIDLVFHRELPSYFLGSMAEIDTVSVGFVYRLHAESVLLIRGCTRNKYDVLEAAQMGHNRSEA